MTEQKPPKKKGKTRFQAYILPPDLDDAGLEELFRQMKENDPEIGTGTGQSQEPPPEKKPEK